MYKVGLGFIGITITTIVTMYACLVEISKGVPSALESALRTRTYGGCLMMILYSRLFVSLIRQVARVGEAYKSLCVEFSSGKMTELSSRHYGDPMALRDRFSNTEKMKQHCWVLFGHAVDMTVVWSVIISLFMAIILLVISYIAENG